MDSIENRTFDEILVGESASLKRKLCKEDIELFAKRQMKREEQAL